MEEINKSETSRLDAKSHLLLESGRLLFAKNCTFLLGATAINSMPISNLNEIAFAGRSNVGKSSLINSLTGRKTLTRISNTPGRTQQINFFDLGDQLMLVDLPGYGYAKASKTAVQSWNKLIKLYLKGRSQLRRVCLLIDARHGLKDPDRSFMKLLDEAAVSYQLIQTKCDKTKDEGLKNLFKNMNSELSRHVAAHPKILATSSKKKMGISELRAELAALTTSNELQ